MNITIDWMDRWANSPRFIISDVDLPKYPEATNPIWEQRNGIHRADQRPFVCYFYNDMSGKPTQGFGGAQFAGTFKDGTTYEYRGAWSSRAACVNAEWPERRVVDVVCGSCATAIDADALIAWWRANETDWGLAWVDNGDQAPTLEPTRNGEIKKSTLPIKFIEHLSK